MIITEIKEIFETINIHCFIDDKFDFSYDKLKTDACFKFFISNYLIYLVKEDLESFIRNFDNDILYFENGNEANEFIDSFIKNKYSLEFVEIVVTFLINKNTHFFISKQHLNDVFDRIENYNFDKIDLEINNVINFQKSKI